MINDLLSTIRSGARKNKYRLFLPVDGELGKDMDVLCHASSIPGRTITPTEVIIKGHKCQLLGETSLDGVWEATFYNTEGMEARHYFLNWMNDIHSNDLNANVDYNPSAIAATILDVTRSFGKIKSIISDPVGEFFGTATHSPKYQRDIRIHQLDYNGNSSFGVKLIGAFPTSVGAIDLDDSSGELSTTTVVFSYSDISIETTTGPDTVSEKALKVGKDFLSSLIQ